MTKIEIEISEPNLKDPPLSLSESSWTRYEQYPCERGFACVGGVRFAIEAGRYGAAERNTNPMGAGVCAPGYYCPEASITPTQIACGGADR